MRNAQQSGCDTRYSWSCCGSSLVFCHLGCALQLVLNDILHLRQTTSFAAGRCAKLGVVAAQTEQRQTSGLNLGSPPNESDAPRRRKPTLACQTHRDRLGHARGVSHTGLAAQLSPPHLSRTNKSLHRSLARGTRAHQRLTVNPMRLSGQ
jgi:hypothetical protein